MPFLERKKKKSFNKYSPNVVPPVTIPKIKRKQLMSFLKKEIPKNKRKTYPSNNMSCCKEKKFFLRVSSNRIGWMIQFRSVNKMSIRSI